jgi:3-oxoacyl-ACP reductase-like protein
MGIFSSMWDRLTGKSKEQEAKAAAAATAAKAATAAAPAAPVAPPAPVAMSAVDVEKTLTALAAEAGQPLNWRTSIVDLMKLLDMDSSLANRKELAKELGYTADTSDSAAMNIWLHKQVLKKFADAGGHVPKDLLD